MTSNSALLTACRKDTCASSIREQKLHFASYLTGRGGPILAAALREGGVSTQDLQKAVASVRDLEFYMPVRAHRAQWTGKETPLVVLALHEDESPEAFDASGASRFLSRVYAPTEPVLVLAPIETDFADQVTLNLQGKAQLSCFASADETIESAAARCLPRADQNKSVGSMPGVNLSLVSDGIVGLSATQITFADDECGNECWAWGDPEYEMHAFGKKKASDTQQRHLQCSGEHPTGANSYRYYYNQDGQRWTGEVSILSAALMDTVLAADQGWHVQFWEDDTQHCVISKATLSWETWVATALFAGFSYYGWAKGGINVQVIIAVALSYQIVSDLFTGGDDFIGIGVEKSKTPYNYSSDQGKNIVIVRDKGPIRRSWTYPVFVDTQLGSFRLLASIHISRG